MAKFMSEHRDDLLVVLGQRHEFVRDDDRAARQSEGVRSAERVELKVCVFDTCLTLHRLEDGQQVVPAIRAEFRRLEDSRLSEKVQTIVADKGLHFHRRGRDGKIGNSRCPPPGE